jgi:hypothetical protein
MDLLWKPSTEPTTPGPIHEPGEVVRITTLAGDEGRQGGDTTVVLPW